MMPQSNAESQEPGHDSDANLQDLEDSSTSAVLGFTSFESGLARAKMIHRFHGYRRLTKTVLTLCTDPR